MQSHKPNARTESAAPTELLFFVYVFTQGSVRAFGTLATLGFAGVSCLKALTPAPPNKSDNKRKQRHRPTNPTASANNDTNQQTQQQTQTTTPTNKHNNKRKQRHRIIIRTTNDKSEIRLVRKEPCKSGTHTSTAQPIQQQAQTTTPNNNLEQQMINRKLDQFARSPERAILLQSPGRKPWVKSQSTYIEPQRGGTTSEPRG